jgi:hypothetical protein
MGETLLSTLRFYGHKGSFVKVTADRHLWHENELVLDRGEHSKGKSPDTKVRDWYEQEGAQ